MSADNTAACQGDEGAVAPIEHRWGAVFVAACGASPCRIAPTESKVTCPACKELPLDPSAWAERDQFAAALREAAALTAAEDETP